MNKLVCKCKYAYGGLKKSGFISGEKDNVKRRINGSIEGLHCLLLLGNKW